jgi:hypothetical protein
MICTKCSEFARLSKLHPPLEPVETKALGCSCKYLHLSSDGVLPRNKHVAAHFCGPSKYNQSLRHVQTTRLHIFLWAHANADDKPTCMTWSGSAAPHAFVQLSRGASTCAARSLHLAAHIICADSYVRAAPRYFSHCVYMQAEGKHINTSPASASAIPCRYRSDENGQDRLCHAYGMHLRDV